MSDTSTGARAPDEPFFEPEYPAAGSYPTTTEALPPDNYAYPAETYSTETYVAETYVPAPVDGSSADDQSKAAQVAGQAKDAAGQAAVDVKDTAKEQAQRVGSEAKDQARNVAADVRDRVGEQARTQNDKLVGTIRQTADQLDEMRGDREGSPAAAVVSRVADGGRQLADYLDRNGPDGVLREVQDFARRRPGAFLATALVAGFVVGRVGKGVAQADPQAGTAEQAKPTTDAYVSPAPDAFAAPAPEVYVTDTPGGRL